LTKKALLLTTAGSVGIQDVLKYLDLVARVWGFEVVAKAGLVTPRCTLPPYLARKNDKELKIAVAAFFSAMMSGRRKSPGFRDVLVFHL
jgi:hypothetical protein